MSEAAIDSKEEGAGDLLQAKAFFSSSGQMTVNYVFFTKVGREIWEFPLVLTSSVSGFAS